MDLLPQINSWVFCAEKNPIKKMVSVAVSNLKISFKNKNGDRPLYTCDFCKKQFLSKKTLLIHNSKCVIRRSETKRNEMKFLQNLNTKSDSTCWGVIVVSRTFQFSSYWYTIGVLRIIHQPEDIIRYEQNLGKVWYMWYMW